ncbi:hypothetical protein CBR_g23759 [Chara braunii]|uniref:Uncharacterized protein n=1 Tax=Chara braunii TaxID=69332 RepID=A0A388JVF4_CHABU|nr:hypothetical protein CBR_g23759 [Chara braunii]|eukprot:GBG61799.1 hypothetical protein CBR_g23759 [Chara braunii]
MLGEGPTVTTTLDYTRHDEELRLRVDVEGGREKEMRTDQRLQLAITEAKDRAERRCRRDGVTDELKVTVSYLDVGTSTDTVEREQLHLDQDSEAESEASDREIDLQSWNRPDQWADKAAYDETLTKLAGLFSNNFKKFTTHSVGGDDELTKRILAAGPQL